MTPAIVITGQNMDPGLTPAQGRVAFHQERLLRSTGTHPVVRERYLADCAAAGLPERLAAMTRQQCRQALRLLEGAALSVKSVAAFRDCRTGWEAL